MEYVKTFSIVAVSLASTLSFGGVDRHKDALKTNVDAAIDRALAEKRIVGTVVLVAQDGKLVYHRAAGFADRETHRPMREGAFFRLASVSKPVVSTAVMRLVDQGVLHLSDPVAKWIPEFRPKLPNGTTPDITLHQLLTHTSGLGYAFEEPKDGPYHRAGVSDGLDQPGLSIDENLRRLASAPLLFEPGTAWNYSLSIDVLGEVVSRATGKPIPEAIRSLVTQPLGMAHTGFVATRGQELVTPYVDAPGEPRRMAGEDVVPFGEGAGVSFSLARAYDAKSYASGGGGMIGTAGDILKLLEEIRSGRNGLLKPSTLAAMKSVQTGDLDVLMKGSGLGFGYGFSIVKDPEAAKTPQSAGTLQWGGVYGHSWFVDPARKLTMVAFTNTTLEGMNGQFPIWVRDAVYKSLPSAK